MGKGLHECDPVDLSGSFSIILECLATYDLLALVFPGGWVSEDSGGRIRLGYSLWLVWSDTDHEPTFRCTAKSNHG